MRYYLKLIEPKPVFNVYPKKNNEKMLEVSLQKLSDDILRNITFFKEPNIKLDKLVSKYKEFANGNDMHLKKLDQLMRELLGPGSER